MTTRKESSGHMGAAQSSCDRYIRPGQAQPTPNPSMERGDGHEVHPWLSCYWQLIAVGRRRVGFISCIAPTVLNEFFCFFVFKGKLNGQGNLCGAKFSKN